MLSISLAALVAVLLLLLSKLFKYWNKRKNILRNLAAIPGPKPLPFIGNALLLNDSKKALWTLLEFQKEFGPTFKLELGPHIHIVTTDPKLIEIITSSSVQINKSITYRFVENWLGTGLLTASNPKWKAQRKFLTGTFHFKILEESFPVMHKNSQNLVEYLQTFDGQCVNIYEYVAMCSLDIICEAALGTSVNALKLGSVSKYVQSVQCLSNNFIRRIFSIWKQFDFLYRLSNEYKQDKEALKYLQSFTNGIIKNKLKNLKLKDEERKKTILNNQENGSESESKKRLSFIDHLLNSSVHLGGHMTDENIRNEVDTFMVAGQDTTSSCVSFTLYALSKNLEVQEKCFKEIIDNFGLTGEISYRSMASLKYLDLVIKESLRIFPSIPYFARQITEDVKFDGFIIPEGVQLDILPFALHRNPDLHKNPEVFRPERFSPEENASRNPFSYIPFSAGHRNCIGQKFAVLQMKIMLCSLIREFRFLEAPDFELELVFESVLNSHSGIKVLIRRRI